MADPLAPQINLVLDPNKAALHLAISNEGQIRAAIVLNADQLEATIAGLTQLRSQMTPPYPTKLEDGTAVREIKGTKFDFGVDADTREMIFSLQDKTLGWLSFRFGAHLLERMLKVVNSANNPHSDAPKR